MKLPIFSPEVHFTKKIIFPNGLKPAFESRSRNWKTLFGIFYLLHILCCWIWILAYFLKLSADFFSIRSEKYTIVCCTVSEVEFRKTKSIIFKFKCKYIMWSTFQRDWTQSFWGMWFTSTQTKNDFKASCNTSSHILNRWYCMKTTKYKLIMLANCMLHEKVCTNISHIVYIVKKIDMKM